jgi:hypothetical protein
MTPVQKLESELSSTIDFPEKKHIMMLVSQSIEFEKLIIMKAYADGIQALKDSITTDEIYDSYLEYYNKNYNKECSQASL